MKNQDVAVILQAAATIYAGSFIPDNRYWENVESAVDTALQLWNEIQKHVTD